MYSTIESPIGPILVTGTDAGLTGLYTEGHVRLPSAPGERNDRVFLDVSRQLTEYFDGTRSAFELPLAPVGTPFQQRVWQALQRIPFGQQRTYGSLAAELGNPNASRAVGLANGRNPISIVVPCHRVVGSDGTLTGYAGGLEAKRWLLNHEARTGYAA
jgi:methylated-DNA-[protein]-cysteine S-methyltransferase